MIFIDPVHKLIFLESKDLLGINTAESQREEIYYAAFGIRIVLIILLFFIVVS